MTAKKTYITVLNVYSCLSVVLLHGSAFWNFRKTPGWIADNFVESFFYFAVPVFVMLSGATLMDYRERCTTKEYFKKRVRKTVIPFLFWSIVGLFFVIWRDGSGSVDLHPLAILDAVINCRYIGIYYFFIVIFGVYLAIPVFSAVPKEKRQRIFLYCIVAALVVNVLLPFLASLTGGAVRHNGEFTFAVCSGSMPLSATIWMPICLPARCASPSIFSAFSGLPLSFWERCFFPSETARSILFIRAMSTYPACCTPLPFFCFSKRFRLISCRSGFSKC